MKLYKQFYEHSGIDTQWESETLRITLTLDDKDLNHDMRLAKRFRHVEVHQHQYRGGNLDIWMKGSGSAWFGYGSKDPQKQLIWDKVFNFLEEQQNLIHVKWKPRNFTWN